MRRSKTTTKQTTTAEFRFIVPDEIHAWALLLANNGFIVQARHAKSLRGKDPDGVMKVSGPAERLATVKKALLLAGGAELLTTSPEVLPTTNMQAMGILRDKADIPDATTLFKAWGFRIDVHSEIVDECSDLTAYVSVRGRSALDEDEIFNWLLALGEPVGLDLDCIGKDDGPTEWEFELQLPERLQREFPDFHRRFLEGEFSSAYAAATAAGLIKPYEPPVVAN